MEPPLVTCPHCGLKGRVPPAPPGAPLACPGCGKSFPMPVIEGEDPNAIWVGGPDDPLPVATPAPRPAPAPAPPPVAPPPQPVGVAGPDRPEDAGSHLEWLRAETKRFNEFVAAQLATLDRRRQELAAQEARAVAAIIPREQELSRQWATVSARAAALVKREEELDRREAELGRVANGLAAREAAVRVREQRVAQLEDRASDLSRREEELRPGLTGLEQRKAELDAQLAALTAQRAEIQKRHAELDRTEAALGRRLAEVDELEHQLRLDIEAQKQELENRLRALENLPDLLRTALGDTADRKGPGSGVRKRS